MREYRFLWYGPALWANTSTVASITYTVIVDRQYVDGKIQSISHEMTGLQPSDADNRKTGVPIAPERTLPRRDKRRHDDDDNPFGTISQSDIVFLIFLKLSQVPAGYALCCMFVFPCLSMLREVKRVLAFPKILGFDTNSSIEL